MKGRILTLSGPTVLSKLEWRARTQVFTRSSVHAYLIKQPCSDPFLHACQERPSFPEPEDIFQSHVPGAWTPQTKGLRPSIGKCPNWLLMTSPKKKNWFYFNREFPLAVRLKSVERNSAVARESNLMKVEILSDY